MPWRDTAILTYDCRGQPPVITFSLLEDTKHAQICYFTASVTGLDGTLLEAAIQPALGRAASELAKIRACDHMTLNERMSVYEALVCAEEGLEICGHWLSPPSDCRSFYGPSTRARRREMRSRVL